MQNEAGEYVDMYVPRCVFVLFNNSKILFSHLKIMCYTILLKYCLNVD